LDQALIAANTPASIRLGMNVENNALPPIVLMSGGKTTLLRVHSTEGKMIVARPIQLDRRRPKEEELVAFHPGRMYYDDRGRKVYPYRIEGLDGKVMRAECRIPLSGLLAGLAQRLL
jgi:hypothetical protein